MRRLSWVVLAGLAVAGCNDPGKDQLKAQIADLQGEVSNLQSQLDAKNQAQNGAVADDLNAQIDQAAQESVMTGSALGPDGSGLSDPAAPASGETAPSSGGDTNPQ